MTIADYANLLIDAGDYAGRNDIAHLFPRFVGLAETKLNRVLRVSQMEKAAELTLTSGNAALPDDYLEARQVVSRGSRTLQAWALPELTRRFATAGGLAEGYAIVGAEIRVRPVQDGAVTLIYYARIPALTPADPVNWLLQAAPDAYLFALVEEIAIWEREADKVMAVRRLKEEAIAGLELQDERARWGNGRMVLGGMTP